MSVSCYVCCQDFATDRSLVQRNTTEFVCVCHGERSNAIVTLCTCNERAEEVRLRNKEEKKEIKKE
jgi:hypothetical protein